MRVLIIEDKPALVEEYLRIFSHLLSDLNITFFQVHSIEDALNPLSAEEWNAILVDFDLGSSATFSLHEPDGMPEQIKVHNGANLVSLRRRLELSKQVHRSPILGIGHSQALNRLHLRSGADRALLKLNITGMASFIRESLTKKEAAL